MIEGLESVSYCIILDLSQASKAMRSNDLESAFGILSVNKPSSWTSRDVVNRVQRLVRPAKAGHAGTLDPLATGILLVCVGKATRLISYVQQLPKTYDATFLLGRTSASDDIETEVQELSAAPIPTLAQIEAQLPAFTGVIDQRPPAYSAIKVAGRRAYQLARQGEAIELEPRPVEIHNMKLLDYEYPSLRLKIECGSGTYVRSLGRDLAGSLGTSAVMSALTRTAIGSFCVDEAVSVEELDEQSIRKNLTAPLSALSQLAQVQLNAAQLEVIRHGRRVALQELRLSESDSTGTIVAVDQSGKLVALVEQRRQGWLGPVVNFC